MKKIILTMIAAAGICALDSCQKAQQDFVSEGPVVICSFDTKATAGITATDSQYTLLIFRETDSIVVFKKKNTLNASGTQKDTIQGLMINKYSAAILLNESSLTSSQETVELFNLNPGDKVTETMIGKVIDCNLDTLGAKKQHPATDRIDFSLSSSSNLNLKMKQLGAKLSVTIKNNDPTHPISLDSLYFGKFNPDKVFLFANDGALPAAVQYKSPAPMGSYGQIAASQEAKVYERYIFESKAEGKYTVNVKVSVPGTSATATVTDIPIYIKSMESSEYVPLTGISRGDDINVVINVRYNANGGIFEFQSGKWNENYVDLNID